MAEGQWLASLQITVAELAVVGAVATAKARSLDGYLKLVGRRVCYSTGFLFDVLAPCLRRSTHTNTPTNSGQCGMCNGRWKHTSRKSLGPCRTDATIVEDLW